MLKTQNRLKKRKEFNFLYRKGEKINSQNFTLVYIKSRYKICRIGISVNNKVGNAVVRNKIKRQLRAIFSKYINKITYKNLIIIAHPTVVELNFIQKQEEIKNLLVKGKILNE